MDSLPERAEVGGLLITWPSCVFHLWSAQCIAWSCRGPWGWGHRLVFQSLTLDHCWFEQINILGTYSESGTGLTRKFACIFSFNLHKTPWMNWLFIANICWALTPCYACCRPGTGRSQHLKACTKSLAGFKPRKFGFKCWVNFFFF